MRAKEHLLDPVTVNTAAMAMKEKDPRISWGEATALWKAGVEAVFKEPERDWHGCKGLDGNHY